MVHGRYDPTFDEIERLARILERTVEKAQSTFLRAAGVPEEQMIAALVDIQSKLLRFDSHSKRRLEGAVEEKKVRDLAAGNLFLATVLTSAVTLTEFKRRPRLVSRRPWRLEKFLRNKSTTSPALLALSSTSLQLMVGRGIAEKSLELVSGRIPPWLRPGKSKDNFEVKRS